MSVKKYLTLNGLTYFLNKIKTYLTSSTYLNSIGISNSDIDDIADDAGYSSGSLPASEDIFITGDIIPNTDNSVDLGASSKNFKMIYTKGIIINGTQFLPSDYVNVSSNQTVAGIKTFSNAPVVNSIYLDGKTIDTDANDNMTFNGNIVDTIEEQGDGYIRYSNGIQICWGYVDAGVTVTINFPKSFSQRPSISVTSNTTDTNSVVTAQATNQAMTACRNFEYYGSFYIAIGRWK